MEIDWLDICQMRRLSDETDDKLWGPSERVVTLFSLNIGEIVLNAWAGCANVNVWYSLLFHNCPKDYKILKRFLELS